MFELWLLALAVPVLIIIGVIALIVKLISLPMGEKLDPMRWKKFGLGLSIALIFPFMIMYGFEVFTDEPMYDTSFEYSVQPDKVYNNNSNNYEYFAPNGEKITYSEYEEHQQIYRDTRVEQKEIYNDKIELFHTILFVAMIGFGLTAIVTGLWMLVPAAGSGLLFGGILSMIFGFIDYFSYMNEVTVFVSLLVTFITLIVVAYKKFNKTEDTGD